MAALLADRRGTPAVEFAILLPALLALLMGIGEVAYTSYVRAVLVGAVQKAARDSGLKGGEASSAAIDAAVLAAVRQVAPRADFAANSPSRKYYTDYGYIAPEPFVDTGDKNGLCDNGESFTDWNRNGHWDQDPGQAGQGGASDVVVYAVQITYPHLFPVTRIIGMAAVAQLGATAILKNQSYDTQNNTDAPPSGTCG